MKLNFFFAPGINSPMANLGLLVLRVWVGVAMLCNHGWDKIAKFKQMAESFPDPLQIGNPAVSLALAAFAEVGCSALLALGLISRFAALVLAINVAVAFLLVHKMNMHDGELAFVYLAGFVTLLIAGPGRYSADGIIFGKSG